MTTFDPKILEKLGDAAREAAAVEQAKRDSGRAEREARVAVLRTVLAMAKPALPAILTKTKFFGEEQHVTMIGARDRKETPAAGAARWQLYITASGTLIEDCREWKRPPGAWQLTGVRAVDFEEAGDLYAPEDVAARLLRHLTSAIEGNNLRRTDEALRRAARYRALASLLEALGDDHGRS